MIAANVWEVALGLVVALVVAVAHDHVCAAAPRHPARLGHGIALGRRRLGRRRARRPQHRRLGLGRRRRHPAHLRDRDPGDDGHRGHARPAGASRHARDGGARGSGCCAAAVPCAAHADRGAASVPRAPAARPARGLRPVPVGGRPRGTDGHRPRCPHAAGAGRGRRRLRQARADRSHPRRPHTARDLRRAGEAPEPCTRRRHRGHPRGAGSRAR